MKVHPSFALDRASGEKKVHQHRLAAADLAPNVEPFERRFGPFALSEQPTERRRFARQPMNGKSLIETRQSGDNRFLGGIAFDLSSRNKRGVSSGSGVGHLRLLDRKGIDRKKRGGRGAVHATSGYPASTT